MFYPILLIISDSLALLISFIAAFYLRVVVDTRPSAELVTWQEFSVIVALLIPVWILIFASVGLYRTAIYEKRTREYARLVFGTLVSMQTMITADFIIGDKLFAARLIAVYAFGLVLLTLLLQRTLLRMVHTTLFRYGIGTSRVMLIGNTKATRQIAKQLSNTAKTGYQLVAFVGQKNTIRGKAFEHCKHYSNLNEALKNVHQDEIDVIIQTELFASSDRNKAIANTATKNHLEFRLIPTDDAVFGTTTQLEIFQTYPVLVAHQTPLFGWGRIVKRGFDLVSSAVAIVLFSPILLGITLLIKFSAPKEPVIFRHKRITRYGQTVEILKFRTMYTKYSGNILEALNKMGREDLVQEAKKNGFQIKNDPRITPIGKFLRRSSLDELPQLFNVLRGDISVVGPRPMTKPEFEGLEKEAPILLSVKSGITGLAQVSGRSSIPPSERVRYNMYYVQRWSFWLDITIIFKTFRNIIFGQGTDIR